MVRNCLFGKTAHLRQQNKTDMKLIYSEKTMRFFALFLIFSGITTLSAKDSPFTRKGTGPKYWIAYEYCWINDIPLPEARWKANIDWVNEKFKSFGYDMICNDGWIEAAQTINAHGYITKYSDSWTLDFKYWADYLAQRDMKIGVYYNPMWMTKAAYEQNVTVEGTNHKARDIVGSIPFNEPLHWVDTNKPGAKEWIQGYVNYFIEIGAKYLRIDFLENYERNYGTTGYMQALEWIKEAAGDHIFLSLVMPNCYNHGQTELLYGDMIRIDDDCFGGGWDFVSDRRRGEQRPIWPQYGNAFDGFIGFADIGGRGQMILDGDFMRMNTMANDQERMFLFSLMVMGGSALAIADQYDTIDGHEWVYQNAELIDLNTQGFVAKPLSYDHADVTNNSRWAGQLPTGDWVVGLFNREDANQSMRIDFSKELGLEAEQAGNVRDLWKHADLGVLSGGYVDDLAPHTCTIVKIENNTGRYEAEVASMMGGAHKGVSHFNFSGPGYVENFENPGAKVLYAISVPEKGDYELQIRYANATGNTGTASLYVNDMKTNGLLPLPNLTDWNTWSTVSTSISLQEGMNYIAIQHDSGDNGLFKLDYIQIKSHEK